MALDMTFSVPNDKSSLKEKIAMIKTNQVIAAAMRKEVSQVYNQGNREVNTDIKPSFKQVISCSVEALDCEFFDIYNQICRLNIDSCDDEELIDALNGIVANDNICYEVIINKVRLKLYGEIVEYTHMFFDAKTEEERSSIRAIIESHKRKIEALIGLNETEEIVASFHDNNELFFLPKDSDRIIVKEILEKELVPKAYFGQIAGVLKDIINGQIHRVKRLTPRPFYEIISGDLRIIFDKLSDNVYIIIDIFLKRTTMNKVYRENLDNRQKQYLKYRDYFMMSISNPKVLAEQAKIYKEIMQVLDTENLDMGGR